MSSPPQENERSDQVVVGVDYGTLSGRAVVVRVSDGTELGSAVLPYPHGVMDRILASTGRPLPPDWALQVPSDYIDVLRIAVPQALESAGVRPEAVIGIGTDFTACTVLPVLADGTPLGELPEFTDRPHAYVKLWKHHAAQPHADRINRVPQERGEPWLARYGGRISSEWKFAKGLQLLEEDPQIYARMDHWVEAADWIVWRLSGRYVRDACTTGYKAIYQDGHHAAVAAGAYPDIHAAAQAMGTVRRAVYEPDDERARAYDALYAQYVTLHDYFGRGGNDVMHRLRRIRREALR